ncbi:MAG: protein-disulfide isomerase [uncultured archaeon A07HR67]|nr:MAG: protein-disulfide isomerase [uncultured archaeon A07HR67]
MTHTRRALLAGAAACGGVGAAGCLGGSEGAGGEGAVTEYDCGDASAPEPDAEYRPALGAADADVVVQAFEDFTCPHCATYTTEEFPTVRDEHVEPDTVRYEHWDFPIPVDEEWAVPVASAARGVGARQGDEAFFAFTSTVYESLGEYSLDTIGAAAEAAGADPCVAIADAQTESYADPVSTDRETGVDRGVQGTPTVYVAGEAVEPTADAIGSAIDDAL